MTRRIFCKLLFVVVGIFGLLVLPSLLSAQGRSEDALEWVKYIQEKHTDALMARPGVVGTAVGLGQGARPIVLVLLEYGGVPGIPQELEGVAVRRVVTGKIYALKPPTGKPDKPGKPPKESVDPTARFDRPVPTGVSTGHPAITAGTIGCRVTKGGEVYALSNNHVYANENQAAGGDPVLQPGPIDGGGTDPERDDVIGTLSDFEWIVFYDPEDPPHPIPTNTIDAAVALSDSQLLGNATPSDGYGTPKSAIVEAAINMPVKKYGRTTGLTKGRVYALNATVDVLYDSGTARFVEQIVITPGGFSAGGDSGSLVVVDGKGKDRGDDRKPVGLLFAGSDLYTVANPIDAVLTALGVSIDGE